MIGSSTTAYAIRKMTLAISCVPVSKRIANSCGSVAIPLFKKRGRKNSANATNAMTAITSQAMTLKPSVKAEPFSPTICSVERLVISMDAAISGNVSVRPARK